MELHPLIYNTLIDPLLKSMRKRILTYVGKGQKVVDIASGTGQLVRELSEKSEMVTGVELEASMIRYSDKRLIKEQATGISFVQADARNLYAFEDESFDVATMSLALHQFDPEDWDIILAEIFRIAETLIIADYSYPLPTGFKRKMVYIIERIAGKEHYRNFKAFMNKGGVIPVAEKNSLKCIHSELSGSGVFSMYVLKKAEK